MFSTNQVQPRIAIIGGGLGGLSLLLTLHRRGVASTLYERDADFSARAHLGGSLDLGWASGQRALRENGLQDEFDKHSRPEGEELNMYDASGKLYIHHDADGPPGPPANAGDAASEHIRPEIDRTVLRQLLLDVVPAESIKWGHALTAARPLHSGQHELSFANGYTTVCDLLVGADGAHSRIRPLVSSASPIFTGVTGAEISLAPEVADPLPALAETRAAVGQGMMFALQDSKMLGSQLNGDGRIRTYAFFRGPADWVVPANADDARTELLRMYDGWAPWMRRLIEHCDDAAIYPRPLFILPVGHRWEHVSGVTLIGDAAHLMSPFSGAGANLAMLDGLELGLALVELVADGKTGDLAELDAAIAAFEERMCSMAGRVAEKSKLNLEAFVHPNAPASAIARFEALSAQGQEREG